MTELQKAILALLNECVEKQDCDVDVMGHIERLKKIAYPCEQDPHAELKAQYARDVEIATEQDCQAVADAFNAVLRGDDND